MDDINTRFANPEEYNDTTGNEGYKIEPPYNFKTAEGNTIQADFISNFHNGFGIVKLSTSSHPNGVYNYINMNGQAISPEWFKDCSDFECGLGKIKKLDNGVNYIKPDGSFLLKGDVSRASDFINGQAKYIEGGIMHIIDTEGNVIE